MEVEVEIVEVKDVLIIGQITKVDEEDLEVKKPSPQPLHPLHQLL